MSSLAAMLRDRLPNWGVVTQWATVRETRTPRVEFVSGRGFRRGQLDLVGGRYWILAAMDYDGTVVRTQVDHAAIEVLADTVATSLIKDLPTPEDQRPHLLDLIESVHVLAKEGERALSPIKTRAVRTYLVDAFAATRKVIEPPFPITDKIEPLRLKFLFQCIGDIGAATAQLVTTAELEAEHGPLRTTVATAPDTNDPDAGHTTVDTSAERSTDSLGARLNDLRVWWELARPKAATGPRALPEPSSRLISSWAEAEEAAAEWVTWFGYGTATRTADGPDGGIDVMADHAVAQVKDHGRAITAGTVKELAAVASYYGKTGILFARAGYTADAVTWADRLEVLLFTFDLQGRPEPLNLAARRARETEGVDGASAPGGESGAVAVTSQAELRALMAWVKRQRS